MTASSLNQQNGINKPLDLITNTLMGISTLHLDALALQSMAK